MALGNNWQRASHEGDHKLEPEDFSGKMFTEGSETSLGDRTNL